MLSFSDWEYVIATIDDPVSGLIAETTWCTGLDLGEVLALTVQQVDLCSHIIRDSDMEIPISADLLTKLRDYDTTHHKDTEPQDRFFVGVTETHVVLQILKPARRIKLQPTYNDN